MILSEDARDPTAFYRGMSREELGDAIEALLKRIPETWGPFDPDGLSVVEGQALFLLATAGLVEVGRYVRVRWSTHPTSFEIKYTVVGSWFDEERFKPGLAVWAISAIRSILLRAWKEAIREWWEETRQTGMPFVCERLQPQRWRLSYDGMVAKRAFASEDEEAVHAAMINVLYIPIYHEGEVKVESCEPNDATLTDVRVVNSPEMAEQNAEALRKMLAPLLEKCVESVVRPHSRSESAPASGTEASSEPSRRTTGDVPTLATTSPVLDPVHNADFTMVRWFGTEYSFALGVQSSAVRALWHEWEKSGLGMHQETIRNAIDPEGNSFRMDTAFRDHPAFGTMIWRCGDGRFKLCPPEPEPSPRDSKETKSARSAPRSRQKRV
jgi:hypothetical protein